MIKGLSDMAPQYIEPTLAGRLKLAVFSLASLALYVAMKLWGQPMMEHVRNLPTCESIPWLRGIVLASTLVFWLLGVLVLGVAVKTLRSGQSPFPGALVWSRTKVRTGWQAKASGWAFGSLAAIYFAGPPIAAFLLQVNVIFCYPDTCRC